MLKTVRQKTWQKTPSWGLCKNPGRFIYGRPGLMDDYFGALVAEDTPESWAALKALMPWNMAPSEEEGLLFAQLKLQQLDTDSDDDEGVAALLKASGDGTIFGELELEPMLSVGDDFCPYVITAQQIVALESSSRIPASLISLYRSEAVLGVENFLPLSYLVIVCPRCQLQFTEGDLEQEVEPDDCVFDDCIACDGTGEWVWELDG